MLSEAGLSEGHSRAVEASLPASLVRSAGELTSRLPRFEDLRLSRFEIFVGLFSGACGARCPVRRV